MENELVSYEHAIRLKELGFDEPCFGFYTHKKKNRRYTNFDGDLNDFQTLKNSSITMGDGWYTVPTYQQAFRWFREKYKLIGTPQYFTRGYYCFTINDMKDTKESNRLFTEYPTYEEAESNCIDRLIEIVKQK
jgi:hypothetical protein